MLQCKSQETSHVSMVSHLQLLGGPERSMVNAELELHHARDRQTQDCQPETRDAMVFLSSGCTCTRTCTCTQTTIAGWLLACLWPRLSCESSPDRQTLLWPSRGAST